MRRLLLYSLTFLLLAACAQATVPAADLTPAAPYWTASPSPTASPLPAQTQILLPTPTPVLYTIQPNDTLGAIAQRFGVSVADLMAANPGVQPTALIVGQTLVIPAAGLPSEPTPTPAPLLVRQAHCWPETTGGLWCLALVQNDFNETVENISAQFVLLDENGEEIGAQIAYAPLDILPAGESMPLGVHFPPPVDLQAVPRVQVLTAIRLLPGDARYLPVRLENLLVRVEAGGRAARLSGQAMLGLPEGRAEMLWLLALAYDSAGNLVGFRRWESAEPLEAGEILAFDFLVSSVGLSIERVDLLSEARP